ncbi:MAG: dTDP-4-dehydrorhamnose reductase [Melioribacteraceae bacterium]|nr:MAG: dTDP-4-dehydrorhamnose reductase [Melioribacteraceae bacterium]
MISSKDILKRRILIIGSNGRLGQSLVKKIMVREKTELLCSSIENESLIKGVEYSKTDITIKDQVKKLVLDFVPDYIINAAAFTNVDKCETERELAWKINVSGVENLAHYSRLIDAHLTHVSTDYVFDGNDGPYSESDSTNPISYYGRTKLASENALKISGSKYVIVRTNVLFGPSEFGEPDFVNWVVDSLKSKKKIRIVTDQINNPTFIPDLADGILKIIDLDRDGVYHLGGREFLNRFEFTEKIAAHFNLDTSLIEKIITQELNQPAPRPLKSGLITLKAETELNYKPRSLKEAFIIMTKEQSK